MKKMDGKNRNKNPCFAGYLSKSVSGKKLE